MRYCDCKGGFICPNESCLYAREYGHANRTQFEKNKSETTACRACDAVVKRNPCTARRDITFGTKEAIVYNEGDHSCVAIEPCNFFKDEIKKDFKSNIKITQNDVTNLRITSAIR